MAVTALHLVGARPAGLQLAVLALENVPVGAGVAHGATPLNERRLRLKQVEGVLAVTGNRHVEGMKE